MRHNFVLGRLPCCVYRCCSITSNIDPRRNALAAWMPGHRLYKKTVATSHENRHCAVTTAAFGQGSGPVACIRYLHYSLPAEQAYVHWVRAFIRFHGVRHPATLGSEVEAFLSGWRTSARFRSPRIVRWRPLLFFYGKVLCLRGSALASGEIGRLGRRGACRWC